LFIFFKKRLGRFPSAGFFELGVARFLHLHQAGTFENRQIVGCFCVAESGKVQHDTPVGNLFQLSIYNNIQLQYEAIFGSYFI
jgi:hypothetical protein